MTGDLDIAASLSVAALAGLAVGIEREWSGHAAGPRARFAGARTFLLLGLLGGISGWLIGGGWPGPALVILAGGAALAVSAYALAARAGGEAIEGTTEAAALAVLALGLVAGLGYLGITGGVTAVIVLALGEKSRIRAFIQRIGDTEMQAALQFAVLSLVLLPLLPEGPFGPLGGLRPRALWSVVLIFSGLNFAGYLARRAVGEARGYGVTGLLGGIVSSTAVTLGFARQSRRDPELAGALAIGVLGASTVLLPRVMLVTLLLNPNVAARLWLFLVPPAAVGTALVLAGFTRPGEVSTPPATELRSPLRLWSAMRMSLAFQMVLMAIEFVKQNLGTVGLLAGAGLLGLTDMDALTMSMSRLGENPEVTELAGRAIAVGVLANGVLKLVVSLVLGSPDFRRRAGTGLAALVAASGAGLWLAW